MQRILITGGGSGLGLALAHIYAARGDRVAIADLLGERAEAAIAELPKAAEPHLALQVDVASDGSMQQLAELLDREWGGVDVVINNAGVGSGGTVEATPLDDWRWVTEVNLFGVVRGCHLFAPRLRKQGRGRIINIASFAGLAGAPGIAAYGTTKAAVVALSEMLRAELNGSGVEVSVVCPTFFRTNLLQNFRSPHAGQQKAAQKLMDTARETAADIASIIVRQSDRGRFLILPGRQSTWLHRLKRWMPGTYFRIVARIRHPH